MKNRTWMVLLAIPLFWPAGASADTFVFAKGESDKYGGGSIEGRLVKREGDKLIVETGIGVFTFHKDEILKVVEGKSSLDEFDERLAGVKDGSTAEDFYKLASWAREKGLHKHIKPLMEKTIVLNPDHEGARRALGYERLQGKWLNRDQLMEAKGFVKHNGKWMTPAERELAMAEEREAKLKAQIAVEEMRRRREEESRRRDDLARRDVVDLPVQRSSYNPYRGYYSDNPWYSYYYGSALNPYSYPLRYVTGSSPLGSAYGTSSLGYPYTATTSVIPMSPVVVSNPYYLPVLTSNPLMPVTSPVQSYGYYFSSTQSILPNKSISGN